MATPSIASATASSWQGLASGHRLVERTIRGPQRRPWVLPTDLDDVERTLVIAANRAAAVGSVDEIEELGALLSPTKPSED